MVRSTLPIATNSLVEGSYYLELLTSLVLMHVDTHGRFNFRVMEKKSYGAVAPLHYFMHHAPHVFILIWYWFNLHRFVCGYYPKGLIPMETFFVFINPCSFPYLGNVKLYLHLNRFELASSNWNICIYSFVNSNCICRLLM